MKMLLKNTTQNKNKYNEIEFLNLPSHKNEGFVFSI